MSRTNKVTDVVKGFSQVVGLQDYLAEQDGHTVLSDTGGNIKFFFEFEIPKVLCTPVEGKMQPYLKAVADKIKQSPLIMGEMQVLQNEICSLHKEINELRDEVRYLKKFETHYAMQFEAVHGKSYEGTES
jgi:hypothetical protein